MTNKSITYTDRFIPYSREEVLEKVKAKMSNRRFGHVLRVEETAIELAKKYGVSQEKASIAALLHDYAKERPDDESRDIIISENMDLELLQFGNNIWHGPVGAVLVRKECRVEEEEILSAIRHHTIGSPTMSPLEKIIFIADYIEPGRHFSGVEEARKLANESLEKAVPYSIRHTLLHLLEKEQLIYPRAVEVYNAWIPQKQEENE